MASDVDTSAEEVERLAIHLVGLHPDIIGTLRKLVTQRDAAQAALREREKEVGRFKSICAEFVRRVEAGEIRSKRTYADMKAALATQEGRDGE